MFRLCSFFFYIGDGKFVDAWVRDFIAILNYCYSFGYLMILLYIRVYYLFIHFYQIAFQFDLTELFFGLNFLPVQKLYIFLPNH